MVCRYFLWMTSICGLDHPNKALSVEHIFLLASVPPPTNVPHSSLSSSQLSIPGQPFPPWCHRTIQTNGATGSDLFCTHLGLQTPYLSSCAKNKALPHQPFFYLTCGHSLSTEQLLLCNSLKKARAIDPAATNQTERLAMEILKDLPVQYFSGNSLEWTIVAVL